MRRTLFLTILVCLLTSCISATREREFQCLAVTMMDLWQTEHELNTAEQEWRMAHKARPQPLPTERDRSMLYVSIADRGASSVVTQQAAGPAEIGSATGDEECMLYRRMVAARSRYGQVTNSYRLVARRVQTRIEEDEMLYPVLGMLASSTAIVLYPLVRWNVRSVLWDGLDPDADDDPLQRFCAARLGEERSSPRP
jgi:hypothetical protein